MSEKGWSELLAEHSEEMAQLLRADSEFISSDTALPAWVGGPATSQTGGFHCQLFHFTLSRASAELH